MTKKNIRPDYLKKGDKAIIVSPSGNINPAFIDAAKIRLQSWGLKVEISEHAKNQKGRFCGSIEERVSDLQHAMDDEENKLIFCSRGGYGAIHLLDKLKFDKIQKSPKWLVGYSDITAIHQAFMQHDIVSLHAPMAKHLAEEDTDNVASLYLKDTLFGNIPQYTIDKHPLNIKGVSDGILFGGNLAVLCNTIGSKYNQCPQNGILFIEDIAERPYQIDRMMWTLKLSGVLSNIRGLIVGSFTEYEEDPLMYTSVYQSIKEMMKEYNVPVCFDFPVGHTSDNYPLLHGERVKLIVEEKQTILKQVLD